MEGSLLLSLPPGLCTLQIQEEATAFTISVTSTRPCSCCPLCAGASSSVHSSYSRTLRDVPCGGHNVRLRRGACANSFAVILTVSARSSRNASQTL
jgi:hypothetical protein